MEIPEEMLNALSEEELLRLVPVSINDLLPVVTGMAIEASFQQIHSTRITYQSIARRVFHNDEYRRKINIDLLDVLELILNCFTIEHLIVNSLLKPIAGPKTDLQNPRVKEQLENFELSKAQTLEKINVQLRQFKEEFSL